MSRNSNELDKKMILVGITMMQEVGASGLSLREVAKNADVNLGMINYHFNGKEDFIKKCLLEIYSPFVEELKEIQIFEDNEASFEQLLLTLTLFAQKNRKLIFILLKDLMSKDKITIEFMRQNFTAHFNILKMAIKKFLGSRSISNKELNQKLNLIISNIGMPIMIETLKETIMPQYDFIADNEKEILVKIKKIITLIKS